VLIREIPKEVIILDFTTQRSVTVYDHSGNAAATSERSIIVESALVISVNGSSDFTIMRTPGNDRELAAGFLLTEGMVESVNEILMLKECPQAPNTIRTETSNPQAESINRNLVVNSSCGLCGRADMDLLLDRLGKVSEGFQVSYSVIYDIPKRVLPAQSLFKATGATHAAALFDDNGEIFVLREDIGRHNAMDKAIGAALLRGRPTSRMGVFLSGRVSLELVVKAARSGISLMVSVSAPTDAAASMADKLGITLTGFARDAGFTIYTHPERVILPEAAREVYRLPRYGGIAAPLAQARNLAQPGFL
jgi:FdhD protein